MPTTRRQKQGGSDNPTMLNRKQLRTKRKQDSETSGDGPKDNYHDMDEEIALPSDSYMFEGVAYSTYQDMVDAKRKRNEQILEGLGLKDQGGTPRLLESAKKKTASQRGIKKQKTNQEAPPPRRKSSRLSNATSNLVALDYYVKDWNRDNTTIRVQEGEIGPENLETEEPRYPKGRLNDGDDFTIKDSIESLDSKWIKDDSIESAEIFVTKTMMELSQIKVNDTISVRKSPTSVAVNCIEKDLASMVEDLSIDNEEWVAKVTPDRIYSVAAHPSEHKLIACVGDKWGHIGLWDVDAPESGTSNGVHLFRVHSRPVCGLHWATSDTLISSSYDGTIRRLNVEKGTFQEIFASYDDSNTYYAGELGFGIDEGASFWHQHVSVDPRHGGSDPCLFVATSVGKALHLDLRVADKQRITFNEKLSERKLNTLSLHPNGYTLASAGNDGTVNLWDIRKFKNTNGMGKPPKPIATHTIGLSVSSSYFSPSGECLLSTSMANKLDLTENAHELNGGFQPTIRIQHDNQTGRWLSTIMAIWHPKHDIFVSGSMKKPRCIEIFDKHGKLLREITGQSLTAVASRCCFHPSTEKLAVIGGNSSGRVVVIR